MRADGPKWWMWATSPRDERTAVARGAVLMQPETLQLIIEGSLKKGDVLTVAEVAGVMAAKRTSELIPLCHPLLLTKIDVTCTPNEQASWWILRPWSSCAGKPAWKWRP